jgi:hypothetical protein
MYQERLKIKVNNRLAGSSYSKKSIGLCERGLAGGGEKVNSITWGKYQTSKNKFQILKFNT